VILVVGATGQVGFGVVRRLREDGFDVRALVRPSTDASAVEACGAHVVRGDLREPGSLRSAVEGVSAVVATANVIVPRRGERANFDGLATGYGELGRACRADGVGRFVFLSVPVSYMGHGAPDFEAKRRIEAALRADGVDLTVVRSSVFMDTWLPALGSRLPLRGAERATVDRGFWLTRFTRGAQDTIERFGIAIVPGSGHARHAFIAAEDVAESLAAAATSESRPGPELLLGGPEALSWHEVVALFERLLGRRVRTVREPAVLLRALSLALRVPSPAASHLLVAQYLIATRDSVYPPDDARRLLGRDPISVEEFLRSRIAPG
jgi:NADH dehydrogenase